MKKFINWLNKKFIRVHTSYFLRKAAKKEIKKIEKILEGSGVIIISASMRGVRCAYNGSSFVIYSENEAKNYKESLQNLN